MPELVFLLVGIIIGLLFSEVWSRLTNSKLGEADARMKAAFHEAARLARRIHNQREVIRTLKSQVPPQPRKTRPVEIAH